MNRTVCLSFLTGGLGPAPRFFCTHPSFFLRRGYMRFQKRQSIFVQMWGKNHRFGRKQSDFRPNVG